MASVDVLADYRLPVVQPGTDVSYLHGVDELGWEGFREREVTRMYDENEVLANVLYYIGRLDSPHEYHHEVAEVARFMTYGILAHQAELDQLHETGVSSGRLPVVGQEAIDSFGPGDMSEEEWLMHCESAFDRLQIRNSRVLGFVTRFLQGSGVHDPEGKYVARNAMVFTHAFLDLQSIQDFREQAGEA